MILTGGCLCGAIRYEILTLAATGWMTTIAGNSSPLAWFETADDLPRYPEYPPYDL
jgi:hypothetical protein